MLVQKKYIVIMLAILICMQKFEVKSKPKKEQKGSIKKIIDPENECEIDEYINDDDLIDSYIISSSQTELPNEISNNINKHNSVTRIQPNQSIINSNEILQNLFNQLLISYLFIYYYILIV